MIVGVRIRSFPKNRCAGHNVLTIFGGGRKFTRYTFNWACAARLSEAPMLVQIFLFVVDLCHLIAK